MVFSSLIFLYGFFPITMLVYSLCRSQQGKNRVLLLFSLLFYGWGEPKYVLLLLFMSFSAYFCGLQIDKEEKRSIKKVWVTVSCCIDIGLIGWFKYAGFAASLFGPVPEFISKIALPIGISFYTFQLLTYVVDVYKGEAPAQKSYWNVLLYASLFHQCIAGPIVRYGTVNRELFEEERSSEYLPEGVLRFAIGLAKKTLLANPCGALTDQLASVHGASAFGGWLGILAYGLQIYLDFSAYSDMAIGMGLMIGLHYPENFRYPYLSRSITEFWRRWHISLGAFFRDYVYIPMGGSRVGTIKMLRNMLTVWCLTGLWHGASWNFLLWGLWFFLFLMIERLFLKKLLDKLPVLSHVYVLLVVLLGWVIFRSTDLGEIGSQLLLLFGSGEPVSFLEVTIFKNNMFLLGAACLTCTPLGASCGRWVTGKIPNKYLLSLWNGIAYGIYPAVLLLLSTASLVGDSFNPFLYFQF